jgi:hypothetical protein
MVTFCLLGIFFICHEQSILLLFNIAGGLSPSLTNMTSQKGKLNDVDLRNWITPKLNITVDLVACFLYGGA